MNNSSDRLLLTHWCMIRGNRVVTDNNVEIVTENFSNFAGFLKALYKKEQISYPKFYKMDTLSKLGFLTSEKLFTGSHVLEHSRPEETGIVIFNSSASLDTDLEYQKTIADRSNYFPSPSVFVYTLPNILIGEICIRNKITGENAFFVSEKFDAELIVRQVREFMKPDRTKLCLCGWVEVLGEAGEGFLFLVEKDSSPEKKAEGNPICRDLSAEIVNSIYHNNEG